MTPNMLSKVPRSLEMNKCRICFEKKSLIYIYEVNGSLKCLARTITDVLKYEISVDDQFPPFVCTDCSDKLYEFKAFKLKCDYLRDAYKLLLSSLADSSDSTITRVNGGSYVAEKMGEKEIVEGNIAELNCDEVSDGALRFRKTIHSKQRPADSDLSDPESNDSFHPTHQDDNNSICSDDKEEMGKQSNEKTICDPRTAADGSFVNNTVSIVSTVSKVSSGSIINSKSEFSGVQVNLLSCDTLQGSIKPPTITSKSDLSHSAKNMGSNHSVNLSPSVKNVRRILNSNDSTQLSSNSSTNENNSVSGHSYIAEVNYGSILQNDVLDIPRNKSVHLQDVIDSEVLSNSCTSSCSQTNSVSPLADVLETEIIPNNNVSGSIQSKKVVVDSTLILQSSINLDSAVKSQSLRVQRNDTETSEWVTKQLKETGKYGRLYPGISTIDLKSFGITFEAEMDDSVPDNNGATILQVKKRIARMNAEKDRDMQSSGNVTLEISHDKLPGEGSFNKAISKVENSGGNLVHGSMKTRETAVLCDDQNSATKRSSNLGAMEVERREFDTQDQESSRETVIKNVPCTLQAIASSTDSFLSSSPSTPHNIGYKSNDNTVEAGERSISKPSSITQGLSIVHHTVANTSNGFTGLNCAAGFSNLAIPWTNSSLIFLHSRPAYIVPTTFSSYKPLPHHTINKEGPVMNPTSGRNLHLGKNNGGSQESQSMKINIPLASLSQRNVIRNLVNAVPTTLNSYNNLSNLVDLSSSVLNSATVNSSASNTKPLGISLNTSLTSGSTSEKPPLDSSEKSMSENKQELLPPNTYRDIPLVNNFISVSEVRKDRSEILGEAELRSSRASRSCDQGEDGIEKDLDGERTLKKNPIKEFLCEFCGNVYLNRHSLYQHKQDVHREKKFKCNMCPKIFTKKHHLIQHLSMHDKSRPFSCKECGDCFKLKTHLKQHEVVHSKKQKYQCPHCDLGFNTKWQHDNHQLSHEGKIVWSCEVCAEKLKTWAEYVDHILEHKKNQIYKCNICTKSYTAKALLKRHILNHMKSFKCSVCGKCFGLKMVLKVHMRIHTGEKPYACKVCGKRFAQDNALRTHMVTHSDARPFKCQFCNHRTKLKSVLKQHEKRMHLQNQN